MRFTIAPQLILRIGLALVFAANALIAVANPSEFDEIIAASFIGAWLPVSASALVPFIAINDSVVALLLLSGKWLRIVTVWAGFWIVGVLLLSGFSLETLEEVGLLAVPIALYLLAPRHTKRRPNEGSNGMV